MESPCLGLKISMIVQIVSQRYSMGTNGACPQMVEWIANRPEINGKALVVGCGLGDDAEWLEEIGFDVTAFDISKSSIDCVKTISRFNCRLLCC